jgi:serine phosphatase RsbU (regulator of sigma subunit)
VPTPTGTDAARITQVARVTAELAAARDVEGVTEIVVTHAAQAVNARVAALSLRRGDELVLVGLSGVAEELERRWTSFPISGQLPASEALRTGRPVVVVGLAAIEARYPLLVGTIRDRERSMICLPLIVAESNVGVMTLGFDGLHELDEQEMEFLTILSGTCAQALDRVAAIQAAQARANELAFLARVSQELASSLDYQSTLRNVARLAVPTLADLCAVQILSDGRLRTLAVEHVSPEKAALAHEMERRYPVEPEFPTGPSAVARTGVSELVQQITDADLVALARDEDHLQLARELGPRSALIVPLTARGRVLGVLTLISTESGRTYDERDLAVAEDVGRRAALAIDNAHLHSETREVAVRLQRAVLPQALPQLPGWELAALCQPAGRTEVGGDFYDAVALEDGRLAVVVGDVMGRGVTAAAAMAQIRSAIRAYIAIDPAPEQVIAHLDRLLANDPTGRLVTLIYLVADPHTDHVTLVHAGHLPPMLVDPTGGVQLLSLPPATPLGAGSDDRRSVTVPLPPGAAVLAFTDGLVERRTEDIDVGLERLLARVATIPPGELPRRLSDLVAEVRDDERQDDVTALVALRTR